MTSQEVINQYAEHNVWSVAWSGGNEYDITRNLTYKQAERLREELVNRRWWGVHILLQIEDLE